MANFLDDTGLQELWSIMKPKFVKSIPQAATITLQSDGWVENAQTITVEGMTSSALIFSNPSRDSLDEYGSCEVKLTSQGTDSLGFVCTDVPSSNLTVNIAYWLI